MTIRRALLAFAALLLPMTLIAQAPAKTPPKAPAKAATTAPAKAPMNHDAMKHGNMPGMAGMAGMAGMNHEAMMKDCPMMKGDSAGMKNMHEAHMKMMAFYKSIMADSVIHARIRDTKALRDQHHEIDELLDPSTKAMHRAEEAKMAMPKP